MNFINELLENPVFISYVLFINIALTLVSIFVGVFCFNKYKKLNTRYERFMCKLSSGEKIEEILKSIQGKIRWYSCSKILHNS